MNTTIELLQRIANAAQRTSATTRSWPVQMPQRASVEAIEETVAELQRDVAVLRSRVEGAPSR